MWGHIGGYNEANVQYDIGGVIYLPERCDSVMGES